MATFQANAFQTSPSLLLINAFQITSPVNWTAQTQKADAFSAQSISSNIWTKQTEKTPGWQD